MSTAEKIVEQLGGAGKLNAMIGAREFIPLNHGVQFTFPQQTRSKPNHVRIRLNGKDLYDIEFYRRAGIHFTILDDVCDVPVENLRSAIEKGIDKDLSL